MTAWELGRSPVARLVLFMICLAVAGSIVAGVHYLVIDRQLQQSPQIPDNAGDSCREACVQKWLQCTKEPPFYYSNPETQCLADLGTCYKEECRR